MPQDGPAQPLAPPRHGPSSPNTSLAARLAVAKFACGMIARLLTEAMVARDQGCGSMISVVEYAYAAAMSSYVLRQRKLTLPLSTHALLLACGVGTTVLSNRAIASGVPPFIRFTLKNGQLLANALMGSIVLRRRYSRAQLAAIAAVTAGLVLATSSDAMAASAAAAKPSVALSSGAPEGGGGTARSALFFSGAAVSPAQFAAGVGCMVGALLLRALRGAVQERAFRAHGACAGEVIFAQHAAGLPLLLADMGSRAVPGGAAGGQLAATAARWRELGTLDLGLAPLLAILGVGQRSSGGGTAGGGVVAAFRCGVPVMWALLAGEVALDHGHKVATTLLVGETSALTSTLVSTLERFAVMGLGAWCSPTPPPPAAWGGVALLAGGVWAYANATPSGSASSSGAARKAKRA